ncbi:hypothetical protein, partial [Saccharothrix sp. ST-888]|uniref:hypothetical protein n=1 Tax=Saccharothrix sp. ST-888 TaxID=1427391 RepID=UPI0005ECED91
LLPGWPGSSATWYGSLHVTTKRKPLMESGEVAPFSLVSPHTLLPVNTTGTGCAHVPGKVNAEPCLTRDVSQILLHTVRLDGSADCAAVAAYSAGGHCAEKLSVAHR